MKEILNLSMGTAADNFDETIELLGERIRVKRLGVDFNHSLIKQLIKRYERDFDAISISGLPSPAKIKGRVYEHAQVKDILSSSEIVPIVDGRNVRDIYLPWAINALIKSNPELFSNQKIGFFLASSELPLLRELEDRNCEFFMADPYFINNTPLLLKSAKQLETFLGLSFPLLNKRRLRRFAHKDFSKKYLRHIPSFKDFFSCDTFILNNSQLEYIDLPDLTGKNIIIDYVTDSSREKLKATNAKAIYACTATNSKMPSYGHAMVEGIFQALKDEGSPLTEREIFEFLDQLKIRPKQVVISSSEMGYGSRFGFVVHPLSAHHLLKHPLIKPISKFEGVKNFSEKAVTALPGFHYGKITGIKSASTGATATGEIYAVSETPKMMMSSNKEKVYSKLVCLTKRARNEGCQLFGLGAYTKIVGDAGVTINQRSPIPVTTGNSLSAAATLWAASYAVEKMGFVHKDKGIYQGTVMVVGATGSIGKVSAMLLSQAWKKIILVAPRPYKLIDLADTIKETNPRCEVAYSTVPGDYLPEADLIITTTSAQGRKILDIEKVKSGCVICDVSRPFDIQEEDAAKRPDVLVIASGEVELPGKVELTCDIGLEGQIVYACLAETALLALEGRFESFSLSRDISYKKVIEIDRLARKHGVKLSAIMGHSSEITEEEMTLARERALATRHIGQEHELR